MEATERDRHELLPQGVQQFSDGRPIEVVNGCRAHVVGEEVERSKQ